MTARLLLMSGVFAMACTSYARVKPAPIFSDNAILQAGVPAPVYGTATPGEQVTVSICGQTKTTTAGPSGYWRVLLDPLPHGGPHKMHIKDTHTAHTIENIAIGELWVCSGQSNMASALRGVESAKEEIPRANFPMLRFFKMEVLAADGPERTLRGRWHVCTPTTAPNCFAVAYFFGKKLHRTLNKPVGLVLASVGASCAENWISVEALRADPDFVAAVDANVKNTRVDSWEQAQKQYADWLREVRFKDPGNTGVDKGWAAPDFDDSSWPEMELPGLWEGGGRTMKTKLDIDAGAVWFRKKIIIPEACADKDLSLHFDRIDDYDITYFNGVKVGATSNADAWLPRTYRIPAKLVKPGQAVIAVRVFNLHGPGGFEGHRTDMRLAPVDPGKMAPIDISGTWRFTVEYRVPWWSMRSPFAHHLLPSIYYNAVIAPLTQHAIRGVIWYQGEGNTNQPELYRKLFPALINDWRNRWQQGDFPFYFVQLARIGKRKDTPIAASNWAELREAQLMTLSVPNTAMAVSFDVSDGDLHPRRKRDMGERLALPALANIYGNDLVYSGPTPDTVTASGNRLCISFSHCPDGLTARDGALRGFVVAAADGKLHAASAKIQANKVLVWCDGIDKPVSVRYGWSDYPTGNLYNQAGLPASPFRLRPQPAHDYLLEVFTVPDNFCNTGLAYDPVNHLLACVHAGGGGESIEFLNKTDASRAMPPLNIKSVATSLQGLAYDSSDDTFWVWARRVPKPEKGNPAWLQHFDRTGKDLGDGFEFDNRPGMICYDKDLDCLWAKPNNDQLIYRLCCKTGRIVETLNTGMMGGEAATLDPFDRSFWILLQKEIYHVRMDGLEVDILGTYPNPSHNHPADMQLRIMEGNDISFSRTANGKQGMIHKKSGGMQRTRTTILMVRGSEHNDGRHKVVSYGDTNMVVETQFIAEPAGRHIKIIRETYGSDEGLVVDPVDHTLWINADQWTHGRTPGGNRLWHIDPLGTYEKKRSQTDDK